MIVNGYEITAETVARIEQWVAELRSGAFGQAKNFLRRPAQEVDIYESDDWTTEIELEGYCCLGVMCQLAMRRGELVDARWEEGEEAYILELAGQAYEALPPAQVAARFGVQAVPANPRNERVDEGRRYDGCSWIFPDGRVHSTLAAANDGGESFADIAEVLEAYAGELRELLAARGEPVDTPQPAAVN